MEADLVTESHGKLALCEIKAGSTFHNDMADNIRAIDRLIPGQIGQKFVVYSGRETSTADGIQVKHFTDFGI